MSRVGVFALILTVELLRPNFVWPLTDNRLDLTRTDTQLHMAVAFSASLLGTELLEWKKVPTWKATAASSLAVAVAGILKEFAIDRSASGSDLMADGIGLGANAALQFSIKF